MFLLDLACRSCMAPPEPSVLRYYGASILDFFNEGDSKSRHTIYTMWPCISFCRICLSIVFFLALVSSIDAVGCGHRLHRSVNFFAGYRLHMFVNFFAGFRLHMSMNFFASYRSHKSLNFFASRRLHMFVDFCWHGLEPSALWRGSGSHIHGLKDYALQQATMLLMDPTLPGSVRTVRRRPYTPL